MSKSTKSIWEKILFMSAQTCILLLTVAIFSGVSVANPVHAQRLHETAVTLDLKNEKLVDVLTAIENQTSFQFSYSAEVAAIQGITITGKKRPLSQVLIDLERLAGVSFRQVNQTIAVSKKTEEKRQSQTVNGKVTDKETGEPIPGVSVLVKGSVMGTTTNASGEFTLDTDDNALLVFSFIGYETQEVALAGRTLLQVELLPGASTLQEIVVIGYGEQTRTRVTGSVSQIKSSELSTYNGSSFASQLAGKASGVVINDASAQPGTDPQIIIRGIGTLTAGRNPLIVVDGFPLSEGSSINSINPQDIASIDILKDPASAAIYGSRAANGVILVTTKKGKAEKITVSVDVYAGFQQRADNVKYVNAYDAALFFTEARDWGYVSRNPDTRSINDDRATRLSKGASLRELRLNYIEPYLQRQDGLTNTNWLDEIFRTAPMSNYNVSLGGGSAKTNFYTSVNYFEQEGLVINNGLKRYSGTFKLDTKVSKKIDFGITLNPSYNTRSLFDNSGGFDDPLGAASISYPFFSPYNADGTVAISQQILGNIPEDGALAENPVATMKMVKNRQNLFRVFGSAALTVELIDGLKFKTLLGGDFRNEFIDYFNPSNVGQYRAAAPKAAIARETDGTIVNYLSENTLTYSKDLGLHSINLLAGYTFQKESGSNTLINGTGIADNNIPNIGGASAFTVTPTRYVWTQISYLGRVQYAFNERYLLSMAMRADGSSRFGARTRWSNFPSVTAGWILSEEAFFPQTDLLNFAKLRVSWGKAGNNQIGSYGPQALINSSSYVYGGTLAPGFAATTTSNPNLSWETKVSTNAGLDIGLFRFFNLTAEYYSTITGDLLLNVPVPEQSGFSSSLQNIGRVKNSGVELEFSGSNIPLGPVKWTFGGNISRNKNEVLELAPGQQQILTGTNSAFLTRIGEPIAQLYGYRIIGVYKSQEEINSTPHLAGTLTGDYIVRDITGDGLITQADKDILGNYQPKFTYGFSSNVKLKNFDLSFSINGVEGRKLYDNSLVNAEGGEGFSVPTQYYFDHRYHPEHNPDGFLAQGNMGNFSSARRETRGSDLYVMDADYIRLRSLEFGYTVPGTLMSRAKIASARIYLSANNLFTATKFRGFNPEATTENVLTSGYSNSNYPIARSFVAGVNITF